MKYGTEHAIPGPQGAASPNRLVSDRERSSLFRLRGRLQNAERSLHSLRSRGDHRGVRYTVTHPGANACSKVRLSNERRYGFRVGQERINNANGPLVESRRTERAWESAERFLAWLIFLLLSCCDCFLRFMCPSSVVVSLMAVR